MAKPELGLKRTCVECNARFYDLNRVPAVCPKCGTTQPDNISRLKRSDGPLSEDKENNGSQNEHDNDVDVDLDTDDTDDVISPDDDLDDDDDDDLSNDIEVTTDKDDRDDN
ncbi:FYDLN acid domain-containing protein [Swingsia samuiensis]|uniref:TIGR02300 family protein n=1 Tax=Swingsia samuiensis TaxID=1293412 RepID=A0A4Y6UHV3_9PROT|nr:FYDLN acid domain-containing protein [Swingsia samuiensis]QDH16624.1 TIGR02300 family protein [Swingsia samuiensis]